MFEIPGRAADFPCEFPLKVIGRDADNFEGFVTQVVQRHVPELDWLSITHRFSRTGKYVSITITFIAANQEQLDEVYGELRRSRKVLYLL